MLTGVPNLPRDDGADVQFLALAEAGILEAQAVLLCESIRQFAGAYASSTITVVSPRGDRRPSPATRRRLDRLDVELIELDIETPCPQYGTSFRVHAAAHVERLPGPPVLVQLDSDTLFLGEPDFSMRGVDFAARPVDVKGMCTGGPGDPQDAYWRELCALCEVDYDDIPLLTTTIDRQVIRASYNGGLVAARRERALFGRTEEFFLRIVESKHNSHSAPAGPVRIGSGYVSPEGYSYWGTSQAALSLACTASDARVGILPDAYNVPLHFFGSAAPPLSTPPIHVHYHWLGLKDECALNPMLDGRIELPEHKARWLHRRMPLDVRRSGWHRWFGGLHQPWRKRHLLDNVR